MSLLTDYKTRFANLAPKEKRLLITLAMAAAAAFYFNAVLKPNFKTIADFKKEIKETRLRLSALENQAPGVQKLQIELRTLAGQISDIRTRARDTEGKLLTVGDVPRFLSELIRCSQGLNIDFSSVKQKIDQDKSGFSRLNVGMKFDSRYELALDYIGKAEGISGFAKAQEVNISQAKSGDRAMVTVNLNMEALLTSGSEPRGDIIPCGAQSKTLAVAAGRNPFAPAIKIEKVTKKLTIKLIGVTFRGDSANSTAIINDNVLRVGDKVEGYEIVEITPDAVNIDNGTGIETLKVER